MALAQEKGARKKRKKVSIPSRGRAYIKATYNNTLVTFTDEKGNVLSWASAGKMGFKGPKKATAYAAQMIVKDAAAKISHQMKQVDVFLKGVGTGRESAVRALNANGLEVITIKDITPIPHNGCRPPRPRRV
ncbi:MAG: 30S ribosomal protein S11 [Parcubacteria group bacterium]|nr:30S ribosomal protein S11 [Parcubacteria group bacterium]